MDAGPQGDDVDKRAIARFVLSLFIVAVSMPICLHLAVRGELSASTYIAHGWGFGEPVPWTDELEFGTVLRYDEGLANDLLGSDVKVEVLCGGFSWVEGPLYLQSAKEGNASEEGTKRPTLLFSDVRRNTVYSFDGERCSIFEKEMGCSGDCEWERWIEGGPNGMAIDPQSGELFVCQHGNRSIVATKADDWKNGLRERVVMASHHQNRRLNSPNDLVFTPAGDLYFTDPSYGLQDIGTGRDHAAQLENHISRELSHNGVYLLPRRSLDEIRREAGNPESSSASQEEEKDVQRETCESPLPGMEPVLVAASSRPNGIALSPNSSLLYVSNSDPSDQVIRKYEIQADGTLEEVGTLIDFNRLTKTHPELRGPGGVDGMCMDTRGYLYQTVPSGVAIVSPHGKMVALLWVGLKVGNCAIGGDGYVYITADSYLLRFKANVQSQVLRVLQEARIKNEK